MGVGSTNTRPWKAYVRWAAVLLLGLVGAMAGASKGGDFQIFDYGIRTAASNPTATYAPLDKPIFFLYGPVFLALGYPLAFLPFAIAKWVWIAFQCGCYFGLFFLLDRLFPRVSQRLPLWLWAFVFLINPVHSGFQLLNIQVPILVVLLLAQWLCESGDTRKHRFAGLLCSLVTLIKVYPAFVLVMFFLAEKKGFRQGVVAGAVACLILPFLVFGLEDATTLYRGFIENMTRVGKVDYLHSYTHIMNVHSLLARLADVFQWSAGVASTVSSIITVLVACLFFGAVFLHSRSKRWEDGMYRRGWYAVGFALTVFLAPYGFIHYFVFYVPLFFWALEWIAASGKSRIPHLAGLVVVTVLVALTTDFVVGKTVNSFLEAYQAPLCGVILLMGMAVTVLLRDAGVRKRVLP